MAKNLLNRYIWLIDTIYRSGRITLDEINKRWIRTDMSGGEKIPDRTFHNHRIAIEEMFGINIACDRRSGYVYYIEHADSLQHGNIRSWLLNVFTLHNLVQENPAVKDRVILEDLPAGRKFLAPVIEAMQHNLALNVTYQSTDNTFPGSITIHPYCLKVYLKLWYVAAYCDYDRKIKILALDRFLSLETTDKTFVYPEDFDARQFFKFSFGINVEENVPVETVRLQVFDEKVRDMRAMPLHASQKEINTEDKYSIFEYNLRPTYDFIQAVLSNASQLEVISPDWLRERVKSIIKQMKKRYKKEK